MSSVKEASTMSLSRRSFVQTVGVGAAGLWISSRGQEGLAFAQGIQPLQGPAPSVILSSNENPLGCHADVLAAVKGSFAEAGRYPFATIDEVTRLIAKRHGVAPENVLLGSGSTQILRTCTHLFTTKTAGLTAAIPAYEECADYARLLGHPVKGVSLTADLKMDLAAMQAASKGAGLVFYCNPNNPVGTAIGAADTKAYLATLMKESPDTHVLVDEAYFEYATMPGYETLIPLAVADPRVIVARTFSKCFGMAGLRIGYAVAHKETIAKLMAWDTPSIVSVMALQGARAALAVPASWVTAERARNAEARAFTQQWFADRGYRPTDSQTNFMFIDVKRPAREFREAALKDGIAIGRDFPPYEKSHVRISVGTMAEMQKAVKVFEKVLGVPAKAA
jgi:histidinol-phosphate aminotransferase